MKANVAGIRGDSFTTQHFLLFAYRAETPPRELIKLFRGPWRAKRNRMYPGAINIVGGQVHMRTIVQSKRKFGDSVEGAVATSENLREKLPLHTGKSRKLRLGQISVLHRLPQFIRKSFSQVCSLIAQTSSLHLKLILQSNARFAHPDLNGMLSIFAHNKVFFSSVPFRCLQRDHAALLRQSHERKRSQIYCSRRKTKKSESLPAHKTPTAALRGPHEAASSSVDSERNCVGANERSQHGHQGLCPRTGRDLLCDAR